MLIGGGAGAAGGAGAGAGAGGGTGCGAGAGVYRGRTGGCAGATGTRTALAGAGAGLVEGSADVEDSGGLASTRAVDVAGVDVSAVDVGVAVVGETKPACATAGSARWFVDAEAVASVIHAVPAPAENPSSAKPGRTMSGAMRRSKAGFVANGNSSNASEGAWVTPRLA